MPSGKSSERLAEEIGTVVYGSEPLYTLNPIDIFKYHQQNHIPPDTSSVCVPLPPSSRIFNGWLTSIGQHVQVQTNVDLAELSTEHDWHVTGDSTLECSITGATVSVKQLHEEIPFSVKNSFELSLFHRRLANVPLSHRDLAPSWSEAYPSCAWELLARIVRDLISTEPNFRQSIGIGSVKASTLLHLHVVLPYLGFQWDPLENRFQPPLESGEYFEARMRRILVEAMLGVKQFGLRRPLVPLLAQFLGSERSVLDADGSYTISENLLSPATFGCLGAVQWFSDDRIYARYQHACTNDPTGGPWFLEALKLIAEHNRSEVLETRVIELVSMGTQTLSMIQESLAKLGLNLETQSSLTDDELVSIALDANSDILATIGSTLNSLRPSSVTLQRVYAATKLDVPSSLRILSSSDSPSDVDIISRFKTLFKSEEPINKLEARCALECLAFSRRTAKLLTLYELVAPPFSTNEVMNVEKSYSLLGLSTNTEVHDISDQDIEAIFEANNEELQPSELLKLRQALRVIANARNSSKLLQFLEDNDSPEDLIDLTKDVGDTSNDNIRTPVGLWNTGNTCYLNSLLQFYYSLPPVREYVEAFESKESIAELAREEAKRLSEEKLRADDTEALRKENPKSVKTTEENDTVSEMSDVSSNMEIDPLGDKAEDSRSEIFEIAVTGGHDPEEANAVIRSENLERNKESQKHEQATANENLKGTELEYSKPKKIGGHIVSPKEIRRSEIFVSRLGKLFKQIELTESSHVTPSEMLAYMALVPPQEDADDVCKAAGPNEESTLRGRLGSALQRQQDVTECIENVLYQMEATMPATSIGEDGEQHDLVKDLFYGTTKQTLSRQLDGGNKRTKTERFSSLLLDVNDGPTFIYDSLDKYFDDELLELEDGNTIRTLHLSSLPQILQIQVQRVQFDTQTYMPYKNINPLIFPEIVYLDRYLDCEEGSDLDLRSKKVKQWKAEREELEKLLDPQGTLSKHKDALETVSHWLASNGDNVSQETTEAVTKHHASLTEKFSLIEADKRAKESDIIKEFDHLTEHGYRIHSLFIHKGDVSYGHYWIYIRDQETNQFYKYNDELVSAVSESEVFDFREQNLATPYFLVFVKDTQGAGAKRAPSPSNKEHFESENTNLKSLEAVSQ